MSAAGIITTLASGLGYAHVLAVDGAGNEFTTKYGFGWQILMVNPAGAITELAGYGAGLQNPSGIAVDNTGNLFIADADLATNTVRKITPAGVITTVAGGGSARLGDGGPATSALLDAPNGLALDSAGDLFIADFGDGRIRKVNAAGIISTVAGNGSFGYSGPATSTSLYGPMGVAVDTAGNLIVADYLNERVFKVAPNGIVATVAGNGGYR